MPGYEVEVTQVQRYRVEVQARDEEEGREKAIQVVRDLGSGLDPDATIPEELEPEYSATVLRLKTR